MPVGWGKAAPALANERMVPLDDRGSREGRPSPDALLQEAQQGSRGRLKIFVGAAPGVGKTYEMLTAARARLQEGTDVVVGVVETHGRKETEALLDGLEVIPRQGVEYKGRVLQEMDLDALLARRPQLALVDELAHTNAPGSRHPKRYMDVDELISAGIDVYTTLNVQHIESLNDVVARITRIRVRETVPDSIIDKADDIELIDLTPDDLIQRLKDGKVYVPHQAERAIRHYFSPGNLTALRELALRRTAQRVDEQMVSYMQAHAIAGPWAAGERVLACVGGDPSSIDVVRHAKRMADSLKAPWTAVHVETGRNLEHERDRTRSDRRGIAACAAPGCGDRHAAGPGRCGHDRGLCARQQLHAYHHRAAAAFALAGTAVWAARAGADPQGGRRERACARPQSRGGGTTSPAGRAGRSDCTRRRCQGVSRQPRLCRGGTWRRRSCCTRRWVSAASR